MILDSIENFQSHLSLNCHFEKAFAFLLRDDLKNLPPGKYAIEGEELFAIVVNDRGRDAKDALLETHQKYIDIQYVLSGTDTMAWKAKKSCHSPIDAYDPEKDFLLYRDQPDSWFDVQPSCYAVFFPEDAHTAMISNGSIHKVILKVAVQD